ncbi:MAG: DNA-directed RNA polymerase subunit omega [Ignavibacteriae bacterium]|nr:DNA-directed RNA polymerase subunit omega [Ignavibacteria bacterium]MBI3364412.1 DNA-directed RNA polymerase subunit omega [Ignavibacteriota bacterium]
MAVKPLNLDELTGKAENIYEVIVILLKRARQINEEMKIEFNQRIEMLQSRIFEPEEETDQPQTNPDQILVAQEFEKRPKPTETAVHELMEGTLAYRYKEEDTQPAPTAP